MMYFVKVYGTLILSSSIHQWHLPKKFPCTIVLEGSRGSGNISVRKLKTTSLVTPTLPVCTPRTHAVIHCHEFAVVDAELCTTRCRSSVYSHLTRVVPIQRSLYYHEVVSTASKWMKSSWGTLILSICFGIRGMARFPVELTDNWLIIIHYLYGDTSLLRVAKHPSIQPKQSSTLNFSVMPWTKGATPYVCFPPFNWNK